MSQTTLGTVIAPGADVASDTPRSRISQRWSGFGGTAIDETARQAARYEAIDLAMGSPGLPPPERLLRAAAEALLTEHHQYCNSWGDERLRTAIAERLAADRGLELDPDREITVTCGATEAMLSFMMAIADPGDEVVVFEPYYENYLQIARSTGMVPRFVRMSPPDWRFDPDELVAAFNERTKLVVLNSPNNPTGKVFRRSELEQIAELCQQWDTLCLSDEVYEHLVFDGESHTSIVDIDGMRERTGVVSSLSKAFCIAGWRIGYVAASPELTTAIRTTHEIATCCAPAPLQVAAVEAFRLPESYFRELRQTLESHRDQLRQILEGVGFECYRSEGGFFQMTDLGPFGQPTDVELVHHLITEAGVAAVPATIFYASPGGSGQLRFCFGKSEADIAEAGQRLHAALG